MHGNQTDSLLGITITADGLINILEEVYIKKYAGIKKVNAVFIHLEEKAGCALCKLNYYLKRKIRQLVNQLLRDKSPINSLMEFLHKRPVERKTVEGDGKLVAAQRNNSPRWFFSLSLSHTYSFRSIFHYYLHP